jgi:hypothetical protein
VCCAGITETGDFIRLYPIRYRRLKQEAKFQRYDLIEVKGERPVDDQRPESFHVDEDSIRILRPASETDHRTRAQIWLPAVSETLDALKQANDERRVSLGIVKPDSDSVRFLWKPATRASQQDREISAALCHQPTLSKTH